MQTELPFRECVHNAYPSDNMTDLDDYVDEILQGMPDPLDAYIDEILLEIPNKGGTEDNLQGMPDPDHPGHQQFTDLDDPVPYCWSFQQMNRLSCCLMPKMSLKSMAPRRFSQCGGWKKWVRSRMACTSGLASWL